VITVTSVDGSVKLGSALTVNRAMWETPLFQNPPGVGRVANVEMTVGRVVRIKRHPANSGALALSDLEGNIEKWC